MCCTSSRNPAGRRRTPRAHAQRDRRHRGCACESIGAVSSVASRRRICRSSGICTRRFCDALCHECACVCLSCSSTRILCFSRSTHRFYFLQPSNGHWNGFFDFLENHPDFWNSTVRTNRPPAPAARSASAAARSESENHVENKKARSVRMSSKSSSFG